MGKSVIIRKKPPRDIKPYMLLPFGMYCNKELQSAKKGDEILFQPNWEPEPRRLIRMCRVPVNSSFFVFIMKSLYGKFCRWEDLQKKWDAECLLEGLGHRAFNEREVLMIEVERYEEDSVTTRE